MNIDNITSINNIIISRKFIHSTYPFNPFFMLLAVKSSEIFPDHKGYFFISESFALRYNAFVELTNKKTIAPIIKKT